MLDREVNRSIASHGGHAELAGIEGATAYLRLGGGCHGCTIGDHPEFRAVRERVADLRARVAELSA